MDCKNTWLFKKPIAHRGMHTEDLPENSLGSFRLAVKNNFPIELDVHIIDDGNLIVLHDDTLGRMTGNDGYAANLKKSDLDSLRLAKTEEKIPLLEQVFNLVNGQVPILIETKVTGKNGELEKKLCEMLKAYRGDVAVQSFDPYSLEYFSKHTPDLMRGQLSCAMSKGELPFLKRFALTHLKVNKISQPHFISYSWADLPNKYVSRSNLPILGWTVRSNSEYELAQKVCSNIIFENFVPKSQE